MPDNVLVTAHVDGIAQEHNETLILELVPVTTLPTDVFFQKYLTLTIVDSNCMFLLVLLKTLTPHYYILAVVSISFSNDDYRASESSGKISVVVTKNHPVATPITLSIIPRTVSAQRRSGSPLPPNIPVDDDGTSPPFASESATSTIVVTACALYRPPQLLILQYCTSV